MKFLIVRLSSLGDIIHTLPIVYMLRKHYPEAQIDWLVGKKGFELLDLIDELDNVYLPAYENILFLQKQKYDYVIDVQGLFKSAFLSKVVFAKNTIGFKNTREFADIFYDKKIDVGGLFVTKRHIVDLNLELISSLINKQNTKVKFLIPKVDKPVNAFLSEVLSAKKSIVTFPATTWESKMWPVDYWYELIRNLSNEAQVYLCASSSDLIYIKPLIEKLSLNNVKYINLVGKTLIKDLVYLIQNSSLVIGMDSAGLHLASAIRNDFGFPEVIGIYGPTSPFRSGPYGLVNNCFYLSELDCIACRKKKCPLGHHDCMRKIAPEDICRTIDIMLKANVLNS